MWMSSLCCLVQSHHVNHIHHAWAYCSLFVHITWLTTVWLSPTASVTTTPKILLRPTPEDEKIYGWASLYKRHQWCPLALSLIPTLHCTLGICEALWNRVRCWQKGHIQLPPPHKLVPNATYHVPTWIHEMERRRKSRNGRGKGRWSRVIGSPTLCSQPLSQQLTQVD